MVRLRPRAVSHFQVHAGNGKCAVSAHQKSSNADKIIVDARRNVLVVEQSIKQYGHIASAL